MSKIVSYSNLSSLKVFRITNCEGKNLMTIKKVFQNIKKCSNS